MADGDRAAADIHLFLVEPEHADAGQGLRGKGFVNLDQVDVVQLQPARFSAFCVAGTGPVPITAGSTPTTAVATTRTSGFRPSVWPPFRPT